MAKKKVAEKGKLLKGRIALGWNDSGQFCAWSEPDLADDGLMNGLQEAAGDDLIFVTFLNVEAIRPPTQTIRVPTANLALPKMVDKKST